MLDKTKEYLGEDIETLLDKSRTQVLRIALAQNWTVIKKKVGRVYKNVYLKEEVDSYIQAYIQETTAIVEKTRKEYTVTRKKKEANSIDELPTWNQQIANARYILCLKLEEEYQNSLENKGETIENFVKNVKVNFPNQFKIIKKISVPTLRRWYGIFLKNRDNPLALATSHGNNKGIRYVNTEVLESIKSFYFNKNKPKMTVVFEKVVNLYGINAISYATLRNYINKDINIIEKDRARMGAKEFKDVHTPFVLRNYEDIKAGEVWTSDGHDLEMMCYQGTRKKANGERYFGSPKLIMWLDVKSRLVTGWTLSWTETTESIAIALKRGIEKYGVPKRLYTDNGKAYKSKVLKGDDELDGIYATLGLQVNHALPYNAQAKHIERWFVDFKESFTKEFETYKGGNIVERPERMKSFALKKIDRGEILEQEELEKLIEKYIESKNHYYYAMRRAAGLKAHRGKGMNNLTPLELFNKENPVEQRKMLDEEKLRLLFMYEDMRKIQQNGIEFMGNIYTNEWLYYHQAEHVKVKYDPHNLAFIYVYLDTGEFLCKAERLNTVGWDDVAGIKLHKNRLKKIKKLEREIIGIREDIREDTNIIEYHEKEEVIELIENKKSKEEHKGQIHIGNGVYIDI